MSDYDPGQSLIDDHFFVHCTRGKQSLSLLGLVLLCWGTAWRQYSPDAIVVAAPHSFIAGTRDEINQAKFDCLVYMIRKVYQLSEGSIVPENADALNSQELLLPGHLYTMFLKERLQDFIAQVKAEIQREMRFDAAKVQLNSEAYWRKTIDKFADVGKKVSLSVSHSLPLSS
jgi:DNA-directed RNA polymerase beta subunit